MGHNKEIPPNTTCAVITVSDTRDEKTDISGNIITDSLTEKNIIVHSKIIIKDDADSIRSTVEELKGKADVIILTGGTGISTRDVTIESISFDKTLPGFGELFRHLSYKEIGPDAIMTRATLGIKDGVPIFCLPGSRHAVKLAMNELIIPEIGHVLGELRR